MGTTTNGGNNNKMINRCYMTAAYTKYMRQNNSPSAAHSPFLPLSVSLSHSLCVCCQAASLPGPRRRPHTAYIIISNIIIIIIVVGHIQHHHYEATTAHSTLSLERGCRANVYCGNSLAATTCRRHRPTSPSPSFIPSLAPRRSTS